ncbi:hypothetical protein [Marinimicrobium sp. ABcell2]|uniref:hypothetical protein n=1 Tax=Marinimicrobium sp. ABcell2 TaxID=3069751 RepID=UPI0027B6DC75|nr:hypothetical protein [Marinimicrobium sp. ABcell2]MDQ2075159.1 hypothetical protein [Marinimicrobium sp. ABcell2]
MSIIVACSGLLAFVLTALWVEKRISRTLPPLGFFRGGLLAILVLVLATAIHAFLYSGAGGFIASLSGQILFALLTIGWLVFLFGGLAGFVINLLFIPNSHSPNNR